MALINFSIQLPLIPMSAHSLTAVNTPWIRISKLSSCLAQDKPHWGTDWFRTYLTPVKYSIIFVFLSQAVLWIINMCTVHILFMSMCIIYYIYTYRKHTYIYTYYIILYATHNCIWKMKAHLKWCQFGNDTSSTHHSTDFAVKLLYLSRYIYKITFSWNYI